MLFPSDLTSFFELIRQHGNMVYSLMFAYASSHSLLLTLFAGYAAHAGALSVGTVIAVCWFGSFTGDVIRFWIGRRYGLRWLGSSASSSRIARAVQTAARLADRHYIWMILLHRYPHGIRGVAGFPYGMVAAALVQLPRAQLRRGGAVVVRDGFGRLRLRPGLGEDDERRLVRPRRGDAGPVPRRLLDREQETRARGRAGPSETPNATRKQRQEVCVIVP